MPIYEYRCDGCTKVFEVFQRHNDPPPAAHECGSTAVTRVLSSTSFVLKGTGWYITDYARKNGDSGKSSAGKSEGCQASSADKGGGDGAGKDGDSQAPAGESSAKADKAAPKAAAPTSSAGGGGSQGRSAPAQG